MRFQTDQRNTDRADARADDEPDLAAPVTTAHDHPTDTSPDSTTDTPDDTTTDSPDDSTTDSAVDDDRDGDDVDEDRETENEERPVGSAVPVSEEPVGEDPIARGDRTAEDATDEDREVALDHEADDEPDAADHEALDRAAEDEPVGVSADPEPEPVDRDRVDGELTVEPAPQPTAFGATTVGGAVAASAMAGAWLNERRGDQPVTDELPEGTDPDRNRDGDPVDTTEPVVATAPVVTPPTVTEPVGGRSVDLALDEPEVTQSQAADRDDDSTPGGDEPDDEPDDVPAALEESGELLPGAVPAVPVAALWDDDAAQSVRERWRDVQLQFVDDPEGATGEAQALVAEAADTVTANLAELRADLDGWRSAEGGDTEHLRMAVRRYRDFLDRLLGM